MDNKNQDNGADMSIRFPGALSLKDLITVVSVAVSLTIAWGVFGTRITLLEKELSSHAEQDDRVAKDVEELKKKTTQLEQHIYDNEVMVDRLYEQNNIPQPKRRTPY